MGTCNVYRRKDTEFEVCSAVLGGQDTMTIMIGHTQERERAKDNKNVLSRRKLESLGPYMCAQMRCMTERTVAT